MKLQKILSVLGIVVGLIIGKIGSSMEGDVYVGGIGGLIVICSIYFLFKK